MPTNPSGGSSGMAGGSNSAGMSTGGSGPIIVPGPGSGGMGSGANPVVDPLGLPCNGGDCPGQYRCWAETNEPPGMCVPRCSADATRCPEDYTCSTALEACVPTSSIKQTKVQHSGSCSVSGAAASSESASAWLLLLGLGLWRARRRPELD
jgi:MYXO-CTERM domain-containing protein